MAPTTTWAEWFVRYWAAGLDDTEAYAAALAPLDPERLLSRTRAYVLLQFGRVDQFVSAQATAGFRRVALPTAEVRLDDAGHELGEPARRDRERWLRERPALRVAT